MKRLNRVSWAPGATLCQVRLFSSEEIPAQAAYKAQDCPKGKGSCKDSNCIDLTVHPPAQKGSNNVKHLKKELPLIPQIKWKCPPKFILDSNWCVATGEEGEEAKVQKQREMGVPEAIYLQHSAIPPSPYVSWDLEESHYDDHCTRLIPITPIEEELAGSLSAQAVPTSPISSQNMAISPDLTASELPTVPQLKSPAALEEMLLDAGFDVDVGAAAAIALTTLSEIKEKGSFIDINMLVEILRNPKMHEKLSEELGGPLKTGSSSSSSAESHKGLALKPSTFEGTILASSPQPAPDPLTTPSSVMVSSPAPSINAGTVPVSGPKLVTAPHPSPSSECSKVVSMRPSADSKTEQNSHLGIVNPFPLSATLESCTGVSRRPSADAGNGQKRMRTSFPFLSIEPPYTVPSPRPFPKVGVEETSGMKPATTLVPLSCSRQHKVLLPRPSCGGETAPSPRSRQAALTPSLTSPPPGLVLSPRLMKGKLPVANRVLPPDTAPMRSFPSLEAPAVKDANYLRNLVRQHGGTHLDSSGPRHLGAKTGKPCAFINGPQGCRNGPYCPNQHILNFQRQNGANMDASCGKVMRPRREVPGGHKWLH
ncbi:hypothetical protein RJ641_010930 [Dillenia turbinata]|uniref:C3H1-type domain-containing protein n=1 Tax=Dillenia turbinata TaxID=194707 RepID=A0AAN8V2W2_9MAGN